MGNSHPSDELTVGSENISPLRLMGAGYFPSAASAESAFVPPAVEEETISCPLPTRPNLREPKKKEHAGERSQQLEREG